MCLLIQTHLVKLALIILCTTAVRDSNENIETLRDANARNAQNLFRNLKESLRNVAVALDKDSKSLVDEGQRRSFTLIKQSDNLTTATDKSPQQFVPKENHMTNLFDKTHQQSAPTSRQTSAEAKKQLAPKEKNNTVEFGIKLVDFYGWDMVQRTFKVTVVLTTRWVDPRNEALIPDYNKDGFVTLGSDRKGEIWQPGAQIVNIAGSGFNRDINTISLSWVIERGGLTTKTSWIYLTAYNIYEYKDFPFDTQSLKIKVASERYTADQLKLIPLIKSARDVNRAAFKTIKFINSSLYEVVEGEGDHKKSIGVLEVVVQRFFGQYLMSIFLPINVLFVMSWCSHLLPLSPPFVMPRTALSSFALLSTEALKNRVDAQTPPGAYCTLNAYVEVNYLLQFLNIFINAVIVSVHHGQESPYMSRLDRHFCYLLMVFFVMINLTLWFAATLLYQVFGFCVLCFLLCCAWDYYNYAPLEDFLDEEK